MHTYRYLYTYYIIYAHHVYTILHPTALRHAKTSILLAMHVYTTSYIHQNTTHHIVHICLGLESYKTAVHVTESQSLLVLLPRLHDLRSCASLQDGKTFTSS